MRCDDCDRPAIIDQPYSSRHLCPPHFIASVRDRVRREFHRQLPRFRTGTVAVALSGGKDSVAVLELTARYFQRRPTVRVVAVSVDEGVAGYRAGTLDAAARASAQLGVEHRLLRSSELLGTTTDEAAARLPDAVPCGFCGVWRRQLLNRGAREVGADVLVLGFNLDDLAQTVLMNLARADLDRLTRMAPHRVRQPSLVPRIAPLASVPEREVYLYASLEGLPFDHAECPYAARASRNVYREVLWRLEEEFPGTRHALLRTRERIVEAMAGPGEIGIPGRCSACGESSTGPLCRSCTYRAQALAVPPSEVRA